MTDIWRGRLVRLRGLEPGDWEVHYIWDQDSETAQMLERANFPNSQARARNWAERMSVQSGENDEFHFAIEEVVNGELVGAIATHHCDPRVGHFSYGIGMVPERRRKGYASEAILLVARFYFQELRYQKMNAQVRDDNAASIALHERLGFTREGQLRRMFYSGGAHHDLIAFGMTAEEFTARQPN